MSQFTRAYQDQLGCHTDSVHPASIRQVNRSEGPTAPFIRRLRLPLPYASQVEPKRGPLSAAATNHHYHTSALQLRTCHWRIVLNKASLSISAPTQAPPFSHLLVQHPRISAARAWRCICSFLLRQARCVSIGWDPSLWARFLRTICNAVRHTRCAVAHPL